MSEPSGGTHANNTPVPTTPKRPALVPSDERWLDGCVQDPLGGAQNRKASPPAIINQPD